MPHKRSFWPGQTRIAKTHSGVRSEFARVAKEDPKIDRKLASFLAQAYNLKSLLTMPLVQRPPGRARRRSTRPEGRRTGRSEDGADRDNSAPDECATAASRLPSRSASVSRSPAATRSAVIFEMIEVERIRDERDADQHPENGDQAPSRGLRRLVAVADGGHGDDRPIDAVAQSGDRESWFRDRIGRSAIHMATPIRKSSRRVSAMSGLSSPTTEP